MTSLVNLQSALSLLTGHTLSATPDQLPSVTASESGNSQPPITGGSPQPRLPAFYALNESTTLSIKDGTVSGASNETSAGAPPSNADSQSFQLWMSENSMTNGQISNAVYSGGLQNSDGTQNLVSQVQSDFSFFVQQETATANQLNQWLASDRTGTAPPWILGGVNPATATNAQVEATANFFANAAQQDAAKGQSIISAFDNHTLNVQNAAGVQGLDYTVNSTSSWNGSSGSLTGAATWNSNFVTNNPDGKQHYMLALGEAELYLTW